MDKFEYTNVIIRRCKSSKTGQYNGQNEREDVKTNLFSKCIKPAQKTSIWETGTQLTLQYKVRVPHLNIKIEE